MLITMTLYMDIIMTVSFDDGLFTPVVFKKKTLQWASAAGGLWEMF